MFNSRGNVLRSQLWIRSRGRCKCTSACKHHEAGRVPITQLPECWCAHRILPAMRATFNICFLLVALAGCSPSSHTRSGGYVVPKLASSNFRAEAVTTPAAQPKLIIYGGEGNRTYLGCLNCSEFSVDSVKNESGIHGSTQASESIFNFHGPYGSPYAAYSPCNKSSVNPPIIIDQSGKYYGRLTLNVRYPEIGLGNQLQNWLTVACRG